MSVASMQGPRARGLSARRQSSVVALLLSSPQVVHAFLSAKAFAVVWVSVAGAHFLLGISRLVVATTYLLLADPAAYASFTLVQVPRDVVLATGWSMTGIAGLHFLFLGRIMRDSIRAKRLTFFHARPRIAAPTLPALPQAPRVAVTRELWQHVKLPFHAVAVVLDRIFGLDGLVGINGPFFFLFFNLLEALEVVSQSYQAYQLSRYVYAPFLNALIVAIIFVSCITHPVVLLLTRRVTKRSIQRLAVVAADLVLDLVYAELIPGLVLLPIFREFDLELRAFPPSLSFNDLWTNNAVAQARFVLVTSYVDLACTLIPHLNFILGIHTFKHLLHHRADVARVADSAAVTPQIKAKHPIPPPRRRARMLTKQWATAFHVGLLVCGVVVVSFHLDAQWHGVTPIYGCKMPLTPWRLGLSDACPCGVFYLNCHRESIQGHAAEIESALARVDISLLSSLILAHCPALEMPPHFTRITRLTGLEIFNSTLVDWNISAAVTQEALPQLHHVFLVDTNMTQLPDALVHDQLPRSMMYLVIHGSNLTHLPTAVGDAWASHTWRSIDFERFGLLDLPASFTRVDVLALTLQHLALDRLPRDRIPQLRSLRKLRISGPAFHHLPDIMSEEDPRVSLSTLVLENTSVSTLPPWVTTWLHEPVLGREPRRVSFFGSPVCATQAFAKDAPLFCVQDVIYDLDVFPYEVVAAQRSL